MFLLVVDRALANLLVCAWDSLHENGLKQNPIALKIREFVIVENMRLVCQLDSELSVRSNSDSNVCVYSLIYNFYDSHYKLL